jgi:hypothetical protein
MARRPRRACITSACCEDPRHRAGARGDLRRRVVMGGSHRAITSEVSTVYRYVRSRRSNPELAPTSACHRAVRRHSGPPGSHLSACGMKSNPTAAQYAASVASGRATRSSESMTTGRWPPASHTVAQRLESYGSEGSVGLQRVEGRWDLFGKADEEGMPGLGEEALVGENELEDSVVGRFLHEHLDVICFVLQPCEERRHRSEGPPLDFGAPEVRHAFERLVESEEVAALRAWSGRTPWSVPALPRANTPVARYGRRCACRRSVLSTAFPLILGRARVRWTPFAIPDVDGAGRPFSRNAGRDTGPTASGSRSGSSAAGRTASFRPANIEVRSRPPMTGPAGR